MLILFTGGSGCGKSSYAEDVCVRLAYEDTAAGERLHRPLYYIAAMRPYGEGSAAKIGRHRRMRAEKGFQTIERYTDLAGLALPASEHGASDRKPVALLECIANLTANEMFDDEGNACDPFGPVMDGVHALAAQCGTLVVVTNDVGSDGGGYGDLTEAYIRVIGKINAVLASEADVVCEMVFGCPKTIKGTLPEIVRVRSAGADPAADAGAGAAVPEGAPEGKNAAEKDKKHMLLIVGAEGSGKRTFAESLGHPAGTMSNGEELSGTRLSDCMSGEHPRGIYHAEALVKGIADLDARTVTKTDMDERVNEIVQQLEDFDIILANEVGNGVIPLEPEVRREREAAGRLTTLLAKRADTVVRMVCGIPVVLKGYL